MKPAILLVLVVGLGIPLLGREPTQVLPTHYQSREISRRDLFAAHALSGMIGSERFKSCDGISLVRSAWKIADCMERERTTKDCLDTGEVK